MSTPQTTSPVNEKTESVFILFLVFLRLGCTSFGGPIAHIGYFHEEFVKRKKWLSEEAFTELVSLCQFLPGPASSQVGIGLGLLRKGYLGAVLAWVGFTLPSALVMIALGSSVNYVSPEDLTGLIHGLKLVAVAVIAQALWAMSRSICTDKIRVSIMIFTACFTLLSPMSYSHIAILLIAGVSGLVIFRSTKPETSKALLVKSGTPKLGFLFVFIFFALLLALPVISLLTNNMLMTLFSAFYRSGALVFGGGHVVLPMLQSEVVTTGMVSEPLFLAGYGAAQAMPGPLFTLASYLGAVATTGTGNVWIGGILCTFAIFIPGFLLVVGAIPFWNQLRNNSQFSAAFSAINPAVVGLLLAAFYQPVWSASVFTALDFCLVIVAYTALTFWRVPVWLVVLLSGSMGWLFFYFA